MKRIAFVWLPADAADRIYFLQQGKIAITASDVEGREFIMRVIEAGDVFGELCFCSATDSPASSHSGGRNLVPTCVATASGRGIWTPTTLKEADAYNATAT